MKTTHKIIASLAAAATLVVLVAATTFWAFAQIETAALSRKHAYEAIGRANALVTALLNAETGQRGYALTGDKAFLQPYLVVHDEVAGQLKEMRQLNLDPSARPHLDALVPLIDARLAEMARVVEFGQQRDATSVRALAGSIKGKQLMDAIRVELQAFTRIEENTLAQREADVQSTMRRLFVVIVGASVLTFLFALSFAYLAYREIQHRLRNLVHLETRHLLDVQEQTNKQLEQANLVLQISEEKLSVTLHSIGDAVIATDATGLVTLLNPLAERLTGWTQVEAAGRPVNDIFHIINQETREPSTVPVADTLTHGTVQGLANHTILVGRDSGERSIADSCAPIRDRSGGVVGAVLVFRDVTADYAVQKAMRDQQFYTRSIIESNVDALIVTDLSGVVTDANRQMEALTGCARSELIGSPFDKYFSDHARAGAAIELVLKDGKLADYALTVQARDGSETQVSFNASTFYNHDGTAQGVFAAARDITERERLYQMLQEKNVELEIARSAAEKASQAKSSFLSQMSHELRTPLNAVLGFAQVMETGTPQPTPAQKRSLDQILKAGWYLLEMINEILDLAQIESGNLSMSREPVSLAEVMLECRAMIEPQAQLRGIRMTFPIFDLPCFVLADRTRVKQILINLLFNAIKYNRADGTVVVDCTVVSPGTARISVSDTGAGLSPDNLSQLFQPFNRLGKEAGIEEGTGIGLVVAKRLVEMMGGIIGVDSTVGAGSVFWVELAVCDQPLLTYSGDESDAAASPPAVHSGPLRTLLYIEDNPANLQLVETLLARRPDIHLLSAADGRLGIALTREFLPEVILMDINLPGINGIEVMKILHADSATAHIPIMALSANVIPSDIKKGMDAGFFRYLTKPIVINQFMEALDVALAFSAARTPGDTKKERVNDRRI